MTNQPVSATSQNPPLDMHDYVTAAAAAGILVVQPRMGMSDPAQMSAGLAAVAGADARTVGTITLDSYTRVGDHDGARDALANGGALNGFPIVAHGADLTREVSAAAGGRVPVQVRHGSANPDQIFGAMTRAGLSVSEGGPVSYCLPYGRIPLSVSVDSWRRSSQQLAAESRDAGLRAHLETFGGCMLGQLCPPSLLVAISVLEAMFFAQQGIDSISLSYAQQTNPTQDVEALAAMRLLASELLPSHVDWHIVLYTYMGVFPGTEHGAQLLLDRSAHVAMQGGAERLIVKTTAEARRIPTVGENVTALHDAARAARAAAESGIPSAAQVDCSQVLAEARALIDAVLNLSDDLGQALLHAFAAGVLDIPYCLHDDNHGQTQGAIDADGRLTWASSGDLPLPGPARTSGRVNSSELLEMLRFTAKKYDDSAPADADPHRIAVVGTGPRGIAVLERIAARLAENPPTQPVDIYAIDPVEVGCGRIWRTDQPDWFLMNTPAGEVTMFSGPADHGVTRAGAGPTLAQWWAQVDPDCPGPHGYAPRPLYGRYLQFVFDAIEASLPAGVTLHRIGASVRQLSAAGAGRRLVLSTGAELLVDRAVLATGHATPKLAPAQQLLSDFADANDELSYLRGDSAADMDLDVVEPGQHVGILGLGLSFYDVTAALTIGRGGRFEAGPGGELTYVPSGNEPLIIAGSRSGVPLPARGLNQKAADYSYTPKLFTRTRIEARRAELGRLDFRRDVLPWLLAEVELTYYATAIRARLGADTAELFVPLAVEAASESTDPVAVLRSFVSRYGLDDLPEIDLGLLARPFGTREFANAAEFDQVLTELIRADLGHAALGNVEGPLKAALDMFRDCRGVIRAAVDFGGLTPESHEDFMNWFVPISSFLAAGPPKIRLEQTLALRAAGVLRVLGPGVAFGTDSERGRFTMRSTQVQGSEVALHAVIDARIPTTDIRLDPSELTRQLIADGTWTSYVNRAGDLEYATGGVTVTPAGFHPIGQDGAIDNCLSVLGIPSEHTRWFTQVGSSRPGAWSEFVTDADVIAERLCPVPARAGAVREEALR